MPLDSHLTPLACAFELWPIAHLHTGTGPFPDDQTFPPAMDMCVIKIGSPGSSFPFHQANFRTKGLLTSCGVVPCESFRMQPSNRRFSEVLFSRLTHQHSLCINNGGVCIELQVRWFPYNDVKWMPPAAYKTVRIQQKTTLPIRIACGAHVSHLFVPRQMK